MKFKLEAVQPATLSFLSGLFAAVCVNYATTASTVSATEAQPYVFYVLAIPWGVASYLIYSAGSLLSSAIHKADLVIQTDFSLEEIEKVHSQQIGLVACRVKMYLAATVVSAVFGVLLQLLLVGQ
jgi:hypothetical protein